MQQSTNISSTFSEYCTEYCGFGFNGKENDNEVKGVGNQQDYGFRIYDPRIGKFLSVDPLTNQYPWNSTYAFAENDVVRAIDLDGLEKILYTINYDKGKISTTKIELPKAGPLGDGVAVQMKKGKSISYFYGTEIAPKTLQQFVTSYEGSKDKVYELTDSYNKKTSTLGGIGHALTKKELETFKVNDKISESQITEWFSSDIKRFSKMVNDKVESDLSQNQKDALTDFSYCTRNASTRLDQFNDVKDGTFFLKFMGGEGMPKRRIGEFVLFDSNKYLKFEPVSDKKEKQLETLYNEKK